MATRSAHLATVLLVALTFAVAATASSRILYGRSWEPVKDTNDKKIVAVAEFAVKAYNEAYPTHEALKLVTVDKGEVLADVGTNYHLYITAAAAGLGSDKYQTFVFEYPRGQLGLTSFVRLVE